MFKKTIIIAEAGVNHNGSIKKALQLIDKAAQAGADIVKFQITNPENISQTAKKASYQKKNSRDKENQYEMVKKFHLDWKRFHPILIKRCKEQKIEFLTSVFDKDAVNELINLKIKKIKIPSGEITNIPLLKHVGRFNRKIILSTGASTIKEISFALKILIKSGTYKKNITLLHCNSAYPTPFKDVNLNVIESLKKKYKINVGLSDHTLGIEIPIAAAALGINIIEKHFTLNKNLNGPDHKISLEPEELKRMIISIRNVEIALGGSKKVPTPSEIKNINLIRQSVTAIKQIKKGDLFNSKNIGLRRPNYGLPPIILEKLYNKKSKKNYYTEQQIK